MSNSRTAKRKSRRLTAPSRIDCLGLGIIPLDILMEVPHFPPAGGKLNASGMMIQGGGPAPNAMIGLARLGLKTAVVAAVGNDLTAEMSRRELTKEGVSDRYLIEKKASSDLAIGYIERDSGDRTLVLHRGVRLKPRDIVTSSLPLPRVVHLDGRDMPACMKMARWAKRVGAKVSFDIGSMRNDVSEIFPLVDHLVVADAYALPFTKSRTGRAAVKKLAELCPGTIVVTEGIKGQVALEDGRLYRQQAFRVDTVDTTGAGDAFHVGYLYGLLKHEDIQVRMLLGSAAAALNCTRLGARAGLPSHRQLTRFLKGSPTRYA
ncbi:hypothetical protein GF420_07720 [candidate division GN15 bacterium]|nr:hypothetical protein [candidate division GN15 bacterium]